MRTVLPILVATVCCSGRPTQAVGPSSIRHLGDDVVVEADGRSVETIRADIAVSTDAAARREAQQTITFVDGVQTAELVEAFTVKPDGRRLPVLPGAIRMQLAPGTTNPQYQTQKQIIAVFPEVAAGDVLSFVWRRTTEHPVFPGQLFYERLFSRTIAWDDATISISLPAGLELTTEAKGPEHTETDENGRHMHRWHWSAPALASDPAALSPLDRVPRVLASTLPNWTTFSRTYAGLFEAQAVATPSVQKLADEIAAGASDRRDEARRLYEWVSRHVRWVAIWVGNGSWIPHRPDEVIANGYGDCKDQAVLLTTLLRVRGIAAESVLVNLNPTYTLPATPTLATFSHMIVFLPEWGLYADTTAGGLPFGTLQFGEYGKPILPVTDASAVPDRLAVVGPDVATERLRTTLRLEPDGRITGTSTTEASGPYAGVLRRVADRVAGLGSERAALDQLHALGTVGHGEIDPSPLDTVGPAYSVSAQFTLDAKPGMLEGDGFVLPAGMRLLSRPGDLLAGPLDRTDLPPTEPTPCYSGRQDDEVTLELPVGYRVARLPSDRQVGTDGFSFESHWSAEAGTVRATRRFTSRIDRPLCEGRLREAAAKVLAEIRRDYDGRIELEKAE